MAYIAASDVTVTLNSRDIERLGLGKMVSFPTMAFGDESLTYPAAGIPMPAIGHFGMKKVITRVFIEQPANGFVYHFDRTNHKLRIFLGAARAAITVANHINLALPAVVGNVTLPVPTGNVASVSHYHDLYATNAIGVEVDGIGVNANSLTAANNATIPGADSAANGGVMANTPGNSTFTGDAPGVTALAMDAQANLANLAHTVTGGGAVAEAALAEMDDGVAPAATTLYMQVIGQ